MYEFRVCALHASVDNMTLSCDCSYVLHCVWFAAANKGKKSYFSKRRLLAWNAFTHFLAHLLQDSMHSLLVSRLLNIQWNSSIIAVITISVNVREMQKK